MSWRHLPNAISIVRLLLVPPVLALILVGNYGWALALFMTAGISDGLDGFLAKRYGWTSELGGILDPLADKLLLVTTVLALTARDLLPLWLTVAVVLRDVIIVSGALAYRTLFGHLHAAPTLVSKLNTLVLIVLVVAVLAVHGFRFPLTLWPLFALSFALALVSGVGYVLHWGRRARREWRARP